MKRYFISMACILAALVSCQKNVAPVQTQQENQPLKVTLTATIGGDDTKVSFVDSDNVLKTAWEVGDKVSVISLDNSYNAVSNDVFIATSAGKMAEFSGNFTNNPETEYVYVFYPALTEGTGVDSDPWQVPVENQYSDAGVLSDCYDSYINFRPYYHLQTKMNSPEHLKHYAVMSGQGNLDNIKENKMEADIIHRSYVVKAELTFPEDGLTLTHVQMSCFKKGGAESVVVSGAGWTRIYNQEGKVSGNGSVSYYSLSIGDRVETGTGTGLEISGNKATIYFVAYADYEGAYSVEEGDYMNISASTTSGDYILENREFNKDLVFQNGKMYRLSATLEKQLAE